MGFSRQSVRSSKRSGSEASGHGVSPSGCTFIRTAQAGQFSGSRLLPAQGRARYAKAVRCPYTPRRKPPKSLLLLEKVPAAAGGCGGDT